MTECSYHLKTKKQTVVSLTFTISQDQIKPELDRVFNSVKKTLKVPGFRKGHLPRPASTKKFGEQLYQMQWTLFAKRLWSCSKRSWSGKRLHQNWRDFNGKSCQTGVITASFVTKPEVKLGDYKTLKYQVDGKEVTDADLLKNVWTRIHNLAELVDQRRRARKWRHC